MSLEHDVWLNLAEKAAFMPDGVKFCGIICNAEVWLVKDKAVEEFLRRPSAKPAQANPVIDASAKARAELRDRFAMAVVSGVYLHWRTSLDREQLWVDFQDIAEMAYGVAGAMLKARGDD